MCCRWCSALGSMLSYFRFAPPVAEGLSSNGRGRRWYALAIVLYVLALFSKTAVVALPAVLAVLYWWKRGRLDAGKSCDWRRFSPLGSSWRLSRCGSRRTTSAQGEAWQLPLGSRVLLAGRALWFYIGKLLWPYPLMFFYPRWSMDPHAWWQYQFPLAAVGAAVGLWLLRGRWGAGLWRRI